MDEGHWSGQFENPGVTPDNKEAFGTAMAKYGSMEDAVVGGYNAQKQAGKPYKLPESMDNLPDDNSRAEFATGAKKLLNITSANTVEELSSLNLKMGGAEDMQVNETLATTLKQFVVDNKIPTDIVQKFINFNNEQSIKLKTAFAEQRSNDHLTAVKECNEALTAHQDFGSSEKLDEQTILFHRALINNLELSTEEADELSGFMKDREGATNPLLRRVMIKQFAKLSVEGSTDGGTGVKTGTGAKTTPYETKKARWPKSENMWGTESDTWEDQSIETKRTLGYGKKEDKK